MKTSTRDMIATILAMVGAVVVFAKLESYSWWLIGSWKGAVGLLAALGVGIALTNLKELVGFKDIPSFLESFMWLVAATVVIISLSATTNKADFVATAVLVGVAWLAQLTRHLWRASHHHHTVRFSPVH